MIKELPVPPDTPREIEAIEDRIFRVLKKYLYDPLVEELDAPFKVLENSADNLVSAIRSGRVTFYLGKFSGRINASISKELKKIGAEWNRTQGSWTETF